MWNQRSIYSRIMIAIHYICVALCISLKDIRSHRIKRKDIYSAVITLLPILEKSSYLYCLVNFLLYYGIFHISKRSLGFGDVRLAGLLGLYLGGFNGDFSDLFAMNLYCWLCAGFWTTMKAMYQPERLRERIAFAPFMFLGLAISNIASELDEISAILG
jgi:prepilin signal peptidase PulO-like enzyme (type II secretory pathway)